MEAVGEDLAMCYHPIREDLGHLAMCLGYEGLSHEGLGLSHGGLSHN